ncbi:MAG: cupredoxin domain-containing protein [Thermoplasmata archaeon]
MDAPSKATGSAGKGLPRLAIALGVVALLLSIVALGLTYARPSGVAPRTLAITVTIDEGLIVTGWNNTCQCAVEIDTPAADTEKVVGEFVRWAPSVIIINAGDTVKLTVKNPRGGDHSFAIEASAGAFSGTTSSGNVQGRTNSGNAAGTQATIEFTALKPGTYVFLCTIAFNDAQNQCHPDHETLTGTIVVL